MLRLNATLMQDKPLLWVRKNSNAGYLQKKGKIGSGKKLANKIL